MQLISAGLTWFLDGVYVTVPTSASHSLNVTVRLRDAASNLLTSGAYSQVQVCNCLLAALGLQSQQELMCSQALSNCLQISFSLCCRIQI